MTNKLFSLLKTVYLGIRYLSYTCGTIAVGMLIYSKMTDSEERLTAGFLFAGATFTLFLISYVVYWLMRWVIKHQDDEQIKP